MVTLNISMERCDRAIVQWIISEDKEEEFHRKHTGWHSAVSVHTLRGDNSTRSVKFYSQVTRSVIATLLPGVTHKVVVTIVNKHRQTISNAEQLIKAEFTTAEMKKLLQMATDYSRDTDEPLLAVDYITRDKAPEYWHYIKQYRRNIMEKYMKDYNGSPASLINGLVMGLFFGANSHRYYSNFGRQRLKIPADDFLLDRAINIYFADFYCHHHAHYVTLVCTRKQTEVDAWCRSRLLPLPQDSPILERVWEDDPLGDSKGVYVTQREKLWVELLYTESIDLKKHRDYEWKTVHCSTPGSTPGGLPKNPTCTTCNLYPRKK